MSRTNKNLRHAFVYRHHPRGVEPTATTVRPTVLATAGDQRRRGGNVLRDAANGLVADYVCQARGVLRSTQCHQALGSGGDEIGLEREERHELRTAGEKHVQGWVQLISYRKNDFYIHKRKE